LGHSVSDAELLEFQHQDWMKNGKHLTLGDVVYRIRQEYFGQIIVYVYQQALEKKPLLNSNVDL
jgi:hypothetical protein